MKTIFLPGAGGSAEFWRPVAERLPADPPKQRLSWPGLGNEPPAENMRGADDLVSMVLDALDEASNIVAQSMGGLIAVRSALKAPDKIRRLVLTATSAGAPVEDLGGSNWRPDYRNAFPSAAKWITEIRQDLSSEIPSIRAPTLLIWGDSDPISPIAVGQRLLELLPNAQLHVVKGGDHDLAIRHADEVAAVVQAHLSAT
jgi:pimeloyl-ACP methyl ester carboxylesterase